MAKIKHLKMNKVKTVKVKDLKPCPRNSLLHPEVQIESIIKSFEAHNYQDPVIVTRDNMIIAGHGRIKACKEMGVELIDVLESNLEGLKALSYSITDNRTGQDSLWDIPQLISNFESLKTSDMDLTVTGFTDQEVEGFLDMEDLFEGDEPNPEDSDQPGGKKPKWIKCPECGAQFEKGA